MASQFMVLAIIGMTVLAPLGLVLHFVTRVREDRAEREAAARMREFSRRSAGTFGA